MVDGRRTKLTHTFAYDRHAVNALSDEELAAANKERPPSEQLVKTPRCPAKLSDRPQRDPEAEKRRRQIREIDGTCSHIAGYGTDHPGFGYCKFHGGNTQAGKKAGARAAGRKLIEERKRQFGGSRDDINITAEEALLEEVRRSVAMVRWLEERIGMWEYDSHSLPALHDDTFDQATFRRDEAARKEADPDSDEAEILTRYAPDNDSSVSYDPDRSPLGGLPPLQAVTFKGTPTITDQAAWLLLYREERAHMTKVAKMTLDAGIAERLVRVAENQGLILATAIRHVLSALNLTEIQQALVPQVVPEILRSVSMGTIQGELVPR